MGYRRRYIVPQNKEDNHKGKFWHGRFKSRLLADVYGAMGD